MAVFLKVYYHFLHQLLHLSLERARQTILSQQGMLKGVGLRQIVDQGSFEAE